MVLINVASALTILASISSVIAAPAPAPIAEAESATVAVPEKIFLLESQVTKGDKARFGGRYLANVHTGAGQNAAAANKNKTVGVEWTLLNGYVRTPSSGNYFDSIGLDTFTPQNSTAPDTYLYVDLNAGLNTKGFSICPDTQVLKYEGGVDFKTFTICHVNYILPYPSAGPEYQVLYRGNGVKGEYKDCADVEFKAVRP